MQQQQNLSQNQNLKTQKSCALIATLLWYLIPPPSPEALPLEARTWGRCTYWSLKQEIKTIIYKSLEFAHLILILGRILDCWGWTAWWTLGAGSCRKAAETFLCCPGLSRWSHCWGSEKQFHVINSVTNCHCFQNDGWTQFSPLSRW